MLTDRPADEKNSLIPIHFGVTGHRDLIPEEIPAIEGRVAALFGEYRRALPHTRFRLLTLLAQGADQVAAEVALACDIEVVAIAPMPLREYEKDFPDPEALRRFRALWNHASQRIELPWQESGAGMERGLQYQAAGAFLAAHSQLLIALWDGTENGRPGGTASVVQYQLEGEYSNWRSGNRKVSPLSVPDSGPVLHVPVGRALAEGKASPLSFALTGITTSGATIIYPPHWQEWAEADGKRDRCDPATACGKYVQKVLLNIVEFNGNCAAIEPALLAKSMEQLFPEHLLTPGQQRLLMLYGAADVLAIEFQEKTEIHLQGIANCSFLAFATLAVFDQFVINGWLYVMFWVFFLSASAFFFLAKKSRCDDKFYDYRALAEGLRVQLSWLLAGLTEKVTSCYHAKYIEKIPWLMVALSNCAFEAHHEFRREALMDLVMARWVKDQHGYYHDRIARKEAAVTMSRVWTAIFIAVAMISIATVGLWSFCLDFATFRNVAMPYSGGMKIYSLLIFAVSVSMAAAGVRSFVTEKRNLQDEASQYRRMEQIFRRGLHCIERTGDHEEHRLVLRELGNEALDENGDWLLYQRSRPIEMRWG